jgi:hypothetical protein
MLAGALSYRLFLFALPLALFVVSGLGLLASAIGFEPKLITNSVGLAGSSPSRSRAPPRATRTGGPP